MKNLVFSGVAATALLLTATAVNASDSFAPAAPSAAATAVNVAADGARTGGHRVSGNYGGVRTPRVGGYNGTRGFWHGGRGAPGGYSSYRRPFRGFILPSYWINPGFRFNNYNSYGLRAPTNGYNWSRYYDDAVLTDNRGYVYDSVSNVPWQSAPANNAPRANSQPVYAPTISTDQSVYGGYDLPENSTTESGTYDGQWTGAYVDDKRETYRGEWEGTYENQNGQRYQGTYRGTSTGAPIYSGGTGNQADAAVDPRDEDDRGFPSPNDPGIAYGNGGDRSLTRYSVPGGYQEYERCLRNRGVAGGAIGAILGGIAGNRIAGRGDRLPGTLIGGGIGAIAGVGVEKLANKCRKFLPREQYRPQQGYYPQQRGYYPQQQGYYPQQAPQAFGWYYPPQPAPVTTITITPGTSTTTTTTTEEVVYENVYTRARYKGKALRRPAPSRKRCGC